MRRGSTASAGSRSAGYPRIWIRRGSLRRLGVSMGSLTAAADGSHMSGAMIALMPTREDAERLAIEGGEDAEQLHLTLYFLGDDGTAWTEEQRGELIGNLGAAAGELGGPLTARVFGA